MNVRKTDITEGAVSVSRFCLRVCGSGRDKGGNIGDSETVVQEKRIEAHDTHKKYTSRRKEKFNSKIVPSTRSAINSDMFERQRHRNKQDNCFLFSFLVSTGNVSQ